MKRTTTPPERAGISDKKVDEGTTWSNDTWNVVFGQLTPSRGRPQKTRPLFKVFGEKIPREALKHVEALLGAKNIETNGVYFAHDSLGCARYAGRGQVFKRLALRFKTNPHELLYFSFYVIDDKRHEREIETALIRIASHLLVFNDRKKRADIDPGDVRDYEPGTYFLQRQQKRGPKAVVAKHAARAT